MIRSLNEMKNHFSKHIFRMIHSVNDPFGIVESIRGKSFVNELVIFTSILHSINGFEILKFKDLSFFELLVH